MGFLRENDNNGEMETWAARMGYLWFCAVARNNPGGNGMQTIVPPDKVYVDQLISRLIYRAFASALRNKRCHEAWDVSAVTTLLLMR